MIILRHTILQGKLNQYLQYEEKKNMETLFVINLQAND